MRRHDRDVSDAGALLEMIQQCKVCRIGMQDDEGVYIVPMNFGYSFADGKFALYFHSAKEGRKIDALRQSTRVCFEMDCAHRLKPAEKACGYGYAFESVMGVGTVRFLETAEEKKTALTLLMRHQTGNDFTFEDKDTHAVCVFALDVSAISDKART